MVVDTIRDSLCSYLQEKEIILDDQHDGFDDIDILKLDEKKIKGQIDLICRLHGALTGVDRYIVKNIDNKTGKTVEEYKIQIRKLKRQIKNIEIKTPNNEFEELLLKNGKEVLSRAQSCIDEINKQNYLEILSRSMKKNEICIGNPHFSNVGYKKQIIIKSIDDLCFNMVEMDCFILLSKLKRKGAILNWDELVRYYCEREALQEHSEGFILSLLSYPYEFMKCCTRYRENKKEWTSEKYKNSLEKAIIKDGQSLINRGD